MPAFGEGEQRQVTNNQAGAVDLARLFVFAIGTGITDVGIGEGDDLTCVGGIGENLLIAGHRSVENHFTDGLPVTAYRFTPKQGTIFKS